MFFNLYTVAFDLILHCTFQSLGNFFYWSSYF